MVTMGVCLQASPPHPQYLVYVSLLPIIQNKSKLILYNIYSNYT